MILFEKFGFTCSGHVTISVQKVSVGSNSNINTDLSRLGFFLFSEESLLQFCVLDSHCVIHLFTFRELSPPPPLSSFNHSFFFANCASGTSITMDVRTEVYNLDCNGSRDYLSASHTQLPSLFFLFSLIYLAFLGFWIYNLYTNKRYVYWIHFLMGGLLLMKALNLICTAEDKHYVKVIFIRVVLLFTMIILIGTGWSFLKPFLQEKDKKVLMIMIPLQVIANLASVDWVTWNQIFLLVDIICCYTIFEIVCLFHVMPFKSINGVKFQY
ncbi:hypothetical protein UlMin_030925 [Ulmus minor]